MKTLAKTGTFAAVALAILTAAVALSPSANAAARNYHHYRTQPIDVDRGGWRLRSNAIGWDNTCFDLGYLPSEFACDD